MRGHCTLASPCMKFGMWVFVLRAALLTAALIALCISSSVASELLACQAKDAVHLQKDDTLKTDSVAQRAAQGSLVMIYQMGKFVRTANSSRFVPEADAAH